MICSEKKAAKHAFIKWVSQKLGYPRVPDYFLQNEGLRGLPLKDRSLQNFAVTFIQKLKLFGAQLQLVVPLRDGIRFDLRCTAEDWKVFTAEVSGAGAVSPVDGSQKEREVEVGA